MSAKITTAKQAQRSQAIRIGDCVKLPDDRLARVTSRKKVGSKQSGNELILHEVRLLSGYDRLVESLYFSDDLQKVSRRHFMKAFDTFVEKCRAIALGGVFSAFIEAQDDQPVIPYLDLVVGPFSCIPRDGKLVQSNLKDRDGKQIHIDGISNMILFGPNPTWAHSFVVGRDEEGNHRLVPLECAEPTATAMLIAQGAT